MYDGIESQDLISYRIFFSGGAKIVSDAVWDNFIPLQCNELIF